MMRKKIVSLCMALALCLSLLPVTALAADEDAPDTLLVGGTNVKGGGYWTMTSGTLASSDVNTWNVHYDTSTNTLTLKDADITGAASDETLSLYVGIYAYSSSGDVSLNIELQGENTITSDGNGIYVYSPENGGSASLTITGEDSGSLDANCKDSAIIVQRNSGNASLSIKNAEVEATVSSASGNGVLVRAAESSSASLSVDGGNLTATGTGFGSGINFQFGDSVSGSGTPSLTVSENAMVKASGGEGGISTNSSTATEIKSDSEATSGGIVFNGNEGTVYGSVTLQDDLEIGEGESLNIPSGASLTIDSGATLTVDGGTLTGGVTGTVNYKVTGVSLSSDTLTLNVGESSTLTATITPDNATDKSVAWESDAPGVATVENGTVTAIKAGTATITATAADGSGEKATCTVTVNAAETVPVQSVSLDKTSLELTEDETAQLTATVKPDDATNKNVTWESSNTSVATVNATGEVTAIGAGTATITVTTVDQSKTATCEVTVTAAPVPVTGVSLNKDSTSLTVGGTETLTATVKPEDATNKAVTWTSSNSTVATVDQNGVVTAVAPGAATITVTTADGSFTAACTVTVTRPYIPPANPNYRITVEATQGGTLAADPTAAKEGATVTLTPVPDRGFALDTLAVTDRFGEPVAVTEQAGGTYTFTMPNGQVTVTVTFEEIPLPFTDVTEGDWFYDAVRYAYENSLMDGVGDSLFAPNSDTTRAQLVTILYRMEGEPEVSGTSGFTDVEADTWYTDAVAWAAANGIVNGVSETEFAPGKDITREQLATILFRYAEAKGYDVSARADLSAYPDADQIQSYAAESVAWAVAEGLIQGFEDNTLRPAGNATRAQIATILMRFCEGVAK